MTDDHLDIEDYPDDVRGIVLGPEPELTDGGPPRERMLRAMWHSSKAVLIEARLAIIEKAFDAARRRLDENLAKQTAGLRSKLDFHRGIVESWHREARADGHVPPSFTFPDGNATTLYASTNVQPTVDNEDKVLGFLAKHGLDDEVVKSVPATTEFQKAKFNKLVRPARDPRSAEPGSEIDVEVMVGSNEDGEPIWEVVPDCHYIAPTWKWKHSK